MKWKKSAWCTYYTLGVLVAVARSLPLSFHCMFVLYEVIVLLNCQTKYNITKDSNSNNTGRSSCSNSNNRNKTQKQKLVMKGKVASPSCVRSLNELHTHMPKTAENHFFFGNVPIFRMSFMSWMSMCVCVYVLLLYYGGMVYCRMSVANFPIRSSRAREISPGEREIQKAPRWWHKHKAENTIFFFFYSKRHASHNTEICSSEM